MKIKSIFALLSIVALFVVSSCNKEDEQIQKQDTKAGTMKSARINTEMTNEEMEAHITAFIEKLDDPTNYSEMNFKEAFEDVEATLNYKYVNYDYSKCANTQEFSSDIQIAVDANGNMSMENIAAAYNQILADWKTKYHSISEDEKTPIVFDITDVTENTVKYTMVVGYGKLDLSEWGEGFVPAAGSIFWETAQTWMTYAMESHLNNKIASNVPSGARQYVVYVGHKADFGYKGPLNLNDPNPGDGFIDNYFWYTEKGKPGYHFLLFGYEYTYHLNAYFAFVQEFINTLPNANTCTLSGMAADYDGPYDRYANPSVWPDKAGLIPDISYGQSYYSYSNLSTL